MSMKNGYEYHLVDMSPWPLKVGSLMIFSMISVIIMFNYYNYLLLLACLLLLVFYSFQWWRDISREASFQGLHTLYIFGNMKVGMMLFILSEVMFFLSFFWAFFHSSLSPDLELGLFWPPYGVVPFNPLQIPLLNTIILVMSGSLITLSHFSLLKGMLLNAKMSLFMTIVLGAYFSTLQGYEYMESAFKVSDSVFGSVFFISTGFHGLHVLVGSSMMIFMLFRMFMGHFSELHCFGFEASAWYWHFVDVVWLFLFSFIYWWSY